MAPTIILIRHAQAEHNATKDYGIRDPCLSTLGLTQCAELSAAIKNHPLYNKIELIVVSPMQRTLQTASLALSPLISSGTPVILSAHFQENSDKPCDTGTAIDDMKQLWSQYDWSQVDSIFPSKIGIYRFTKQGVTARAIAARNWLRNRPEKVIAVVSHSGFLRVGVSHRFYANADFRIFEFGEGAGEVGGRLVEWKETEGEEPEDKRETTAGGMRNSMWGVPGWETQVIPSDDQVDMEVGSQQAEWKKAEDKEVTPVVRMGNGKLGLSSCGTQIILEEGQVDGEVTKEKLST